MVPSIERFHCIQDSQLGPSGALYREVSLYTGQPAGPSGVLYREVSLYTGQPAGPSGVLYREIPLYIKVHSLEPQTALNTRQPVAQV